MKEIKKEEMSLIDGGADPILVTSIIATVITFLVGVFYGYSNPKKCNS